MGELGFLRQYLLLLHVFACVRARLCVRARACAFVTMVYALLESHVFSSSACAVVGLYTWSTGT